MQYYIYYVWCINSNDTMQYSLCFLYIIHTEEETPYIVSVRARTSAGYGENESIVVFSTQGGLPSEYTKYYQCVFVLNINHALLH